MKMSDVPENTCPLCEWYGEQEEMNREEFLDHIEVTYFCHYCEDEYVNCIPKERTKE